MPAAAKESQSCGAAEAVTADLFGVQQHAAQKTEHKPDQDPTF